MNLNSYMSKRLKEIWLDGKWIANTNFKEQLSQTSYAQAIHKVENLNSIALLTFHVNYYIEGLNQVFEGGKLEIKDIHSFEMPELKCESDWNKLVEDFILNAERFIAHVENMNLEQLQQPFVKESYGTNLRHIEAQIEHGYYHLGQISLIKKLILSGSKLD
jgi:uncharacterized damage-inducible protein DinB